MRYIDPAAIAVGLGLLALACSETLSGCAGTAEQRQADLSHVMSVARGVCTVCNNACRLVPGAPQSVVTSSGTAP